MVLVIRDSLVMDTRAVTLVTCAPMDHTRVMKMHGVPKLVQEDLSARCDVMTFLNYICH